MIRKKRCFRMVTRQFIRASIFDQLNIILVGSIILGALLALADKIDPDHANLCTPTSFYFGLGLATLSASLRVLVSIANCFERGFINGVFHNELKTNSCVRIVDGYLVRLNLLEIFFVSEFGSVHELAGIHDLEADWTNEKKIKTAVYNAIVKDQPVHVDKKKVTNVETLIKVAQLVGTIELSLVPVITP